MVYLTTYQSDLGEILLASDGTNLIGLWFKDQKYYGANLINDITKTTKKDDLVIFEETKKWLDEYFSGQQPALKQLKISFNGSAFAKEVWQVLCEIKYGQTISYKEVGEIVAQRMNKTTMSNQAIGGAVGHNPISIIVPCHRVVGTNLSLTGYAGGIERKIKLLELEQVDTKQFKRPNRGSAL